MVVAAMLLMLAAAEPRAAVAAPAGARACTGCHAPSAVAGVPPLAGRPASEIIEAMRAFRAQERPATVMDRIAKGFTEAETEAVAQWFSGQQKGR